MKTESVNSGPLADALEALRQEVARLGERVAALERNPGPGPRDAAAPRPPAAPQPAPPPPQPQADEGLTEELVMVIGAAVAAFLGKKAHVRQIRLVGAAAWSQQGRVTIQASHALSLHHNRSHP